MEAKKAGWEIRPTSGEDFQAFAKEVIDQPPEVVEWLKNYWQNENGERACA